jgi:hypothetical protein
MDQLLKVSLVRVKRMELARSNGQITLFTSAILKIIFSMGKAFITIRIWAKLMKESLCMEKLKDWGQNSGKKAKLMKDIF